MRENMKKYLTKKYYDEIEILEVERETAESVWIKGSRSAKSTTYSIYHDTFDSAKQFLIELHERDIKAAREKIQRAESALGLIRKLTEADTKTAA